jgi:hypothetical protein
MNRSMIFRQVAVVLLLAAALFSQTVLATTPRLDQVRVTGRYTGGATVLCQGLGCAGLWPAPARPLDFLPGSVASLIEGPPSAADVACASTVAEREQAVWEHYLQSMTERFGANAAEEDADLMGGTITITFAGGQTAEYTRTSTPFGSPSSGVSESTDPGCD